MSSIPYFIKGWVGTSTISSYLFPSMKIPSLPQEIIELIIDELGQHNDDMRSRMSLYNCSLACHYFRSRAIVHIFGTVTIGQGSTGDAMHRRLTGLHHILEKNPEIGQVIHGLEIEGNSNLFEVDPGASKSFWERENATLPLLVKCLPSIQRFTLGEKYASVSWMALPKNMSAPFEAIIQLPSLRRLEIRNIKHVPINLLPNCPSLTEISFTWVECHLYVSDSKPCSPPLYPSTPVQNQVQSSLPSTSWLESIMASSSPSVVEFLLSLPTEVAIFSRLRRLHIGISQVKDITSAWSVMLAAAQTLEELEITSSAADTQNLPDIFDLGLLPSLRHLGLKCSIDPSESDSRFPTILLNWLKLRESPSHLETLTVNIDWEAIPLGDEELLLHPSQGWALLDELLADRKYVALRGVKLTLEFGFMWWLPSLCLSTLINKRIRPLTDLLFPSIRTSERNILDIDIKPYGIADSPW
ncbi:hypothetical protein GALMADRAFT_153365 [Galerina marginata CBS 339.88]|uniref:F-box domain-containing protein n=1 Tax=Galerina marginata (strain CBS 339.88) TaxID=685588 RepID=A0A067TCY9_GALM3|nr:hypothetical protein GALMADRAFT_153365 [Galerina marginata CBS 339.88]